MSSETIKNPFNNKKQPIIICAFPGMGKTDLCQSYDPEVDDVRKYVEFPVDYYKYIDKEKGELNSNFPENFIEGLKAKLVNSQGTEFILLPSHKEIRDILFENNLIFYMILPEKKLFKQFIRKFIKLGKSFEYIKLLAEEWDNWLKEHYDYEKCHIISLGARRGKALTISDYLEGTSRPKKYVWSDDSDWNLTPGTDMEIE